MLNLAEKMNKPSHLSFAYHHMSTTSLYLGRLGDFFEFRRRGVSCIDTYAKAGMAAEGLVLVDEALKEAAPAEYHMVEPDLLRCKGELLLVNGNPEVEAEAYFLKSIEMARNIEAKSWELRAALSLCRLWQRQGKEDAAHRLLGHIYCWFTEGFDTPDLIDARQLLNELAS